MIVKYKKHRYNSAWLDVYCSCGQPSLGWMDYRKGDMDWILKHSCSRCREPYFDVTDLNVAIILCMTSGNGLVSEVLDWVLNAEDSLTS